MKSVFSSFRRQDILGNRRGIALLLVLTMLLLLSIMVVGLLISAKQEVAASKAFSDSSEVRLLANMTGDFVISQLAQATNQNPNNPANNDWAWISQPGMLRTFSPGGQQAVYKLYSSDNMVDTSSSAGSLASLAADVPANWADQGANPNVYVDLNQPVTLQLAGINENKVYPIVDPNAVPTGSYPYQPSGVEGFQIGLKAGNPVAIPVAAAAASAPTPNPLPMPVKWLYVTADGQLFTTNSADAKYKTATARIAFWADDETCKVNLNTACGGVFYDTPCAQTLEDNMLGRTQPIAQEYQRWPGHPATTSLVPLFSQLRGTSGTTGINGAGTVNDPVTLGRLTAAMTPRIAYAPPGTSAGTEPMGSDGGTAYAWVQANTETGGEVGAGMQVTLDSDRLYASFDEAMYDSPAAPNAGAPLKGVSRTLNTVLTQAVAEGGNPLPGTMTVDKQIDQLRFFATVHSKAPELNLFNRPRVTIWPFNYEMVNSNAPGYTGPPSTPGSTGAEMTPEDKLIQFASELGGVTIAANGQSTLDYTKRKRFYFERESAWTPTTDWTIPENQALFTYLQDMTSKPIPAATSRAGGKAIADKFGTFDRDQILTEIWDYIRSDVNNVNYAYVPVGLTGYSFPQNLTDGQGKIGTAVTGFTDVAPLVIPTNTPTVPSGTKGLGRYPVPAEFIFQFFNSVTTTAAEVSAQAAPTEALETDSSGNYVLQPTTFGGTTGATSVPYVVRKVRMVMLIHFQMPIAHVQGSTPSFQIQVTGNSFGLEILPPTSMGSIQGIRLEGETAWRTVQPTTTPYIVVNGSDFNFPNAGPRNICYVDGAATEPWWCPRSAYGGSLGIICPFLSRAWSTSAMQDTTEPENAAVAYKVLLNSQNFNLPASPATNSAGQLLTPSPSDIAASAALPVRFPKGLLGAGASAGYAQGRCDVYYPFCSKVIEFRLPNSMAGTLGQLAGPYATGPSAAGTHPLALPSNYSATPCDFFNQVIFTGTPNGGAGMTVAIYPGLKDGSTCNTDLSVATNWQPITAIGNTNYLFKTTISVAPCNSLPLPRLGPQVNPGQAYGFKLGYNASLDSLTHAAYGGGSQPYQQIPYTFAAMGDYLVRTNNWDGDYVMNVPHPFSNTNDQGGVGSNSEQMDVFRSYVLAGESAPFGDLRMVAARRDIPPNWYVPHANYTDPLTFHACYYMPDNFIGGIPPPGKPIPNGSPENTLLVASPLDGTTASSAIPGVIEARQGRFGVTGNNATEAYGWGWAPSRAASQDMRNAARADTSEFVNSSTVGDFCLGYGDGAIGALVVGPDEGGMSWYVDSEVDFTGASSSGDYSPYYNWDMGNTSRVTNGSTTQLQGNGYWRNVTGTLFSPFKQVPSPVIFGTLPARVDLNSGGTGSVSDPPGPWENLLFCPNPEGGQATHRGWVDLPRDHFLLDLFYMPVVEPYAITDDFATAGKINLNCEIAPFTYIDRKTALYALMDEMTWRWGPGERPNAGGSSGMPVHPLDYGSAIVGIPGNTAALAYGITPSTGVVTVEDAPIRNGNNYMYRNFGSQYGASDPFLAPFSGGFRYYVDIPNTLQQFDTRFANNDMFVSPSEICEMFLLPQGQTPYGKYNASTYTAGNVESNFWATKTMTGIDKREMPYNHLYPRVTTRSNTFRVHFWVQTLNPKGLTAPGAPGGTNPAPIVTGEYRGSMIVERYLDPNLTAYGTGSASAGAGITVDDVYPFMNTLYKYRKIELRQFSP